MDFWSIERQGKVSKTLEAPADPAEPEKDDLRIAQQHDYDRLLFSPPVRRLANKTQVFPLEKNDTVISNGTSMFLHGTKS